MSIYTHGRKNFYAHRAAGKNPESLPRYIHNSCGCCELWNYARGFFPQPKTLNVMEVLLKTAIACPRQKSRSRRVSRQAAGIGYYGRDQLNVEVRA